MWRRNSFSRKVFIVCNYTFCLLVSLVCIIPIINILAISFSGNVAVTSGKVTLLPVDFTLDAYKNLIEDVAFFKSMSVSLIRVILAELISMFVIILAAYPLSKTQRHFHYRQVYVWYFMITMIVGGGLIPSYLVVAKLGLIDTVWALVLPTAVNVYYVILFQNYIKTLPDEIMEAAYIDGAGHWTNLVKIVLPLSKPIIATLVLFIAVDHWNEWFNGLIYMNNPSNYPLQSYLQTVVTEIDPTTMVIDPDLMNISTKSNKSAQIFLALLPVMCVYPFLQKHFAGGIVMGSVKG